MSNSLFIFKISMILINFLLFFTFSNELQAARIINTTAKEALLIDFDTNRILLNKNANVRTEVPGCSLCMGNQARVEPNSTVVSTSTRNFPNRLGDGADVFLASAELAAGRLGAAVTEGRKLRRRVQAITKASQPRAF